MSKCPAHWLISLVSKRRLHLLRRQEDVIWSWMKSFLTAKNKDLGRSGPVCPYVSSAMKKGRIKLKVVSSTDTDGIAQEVLRYAQDHRRCLRKSI
jgi:hypothetical protein